MENNNEVRIDICNNGYKIYCYFTNRYFSRINPKNNEYIPIIFDTREAVIKECEESKYNIVNLRQLTKRIWTSNWRFYSHSLMRQKDRNYYGRY